MDEVHARSVKIFYSYSHKDEGMRDALGKHLGKMNISEWHDRKIKAGDNWEEQIDEYLEKADIILLLISVDFMTSDYCVSKEMKRALEMHKAKQARVIPINLRPTYLSKSAPFSHIQALPRDAKAITLWTNLDSAYTNILPDIIDRRWKNMIKRLKSTLKTLPSDEIRGICLLILILIG